MKEYKCKASPYHTQGVKRLSGNAPRRKNHRNWQENHGVQNQTRLAKAIKFTKNVILKDS